MTASADIAIRLRLENAASQGLNQAQRSAQQGAQATATATERAASRAAAAATRGATMQRNAYQRMTQARAQLGVRSERTIQQEINRTASAYNRLSRSGTMSWREQARAAEAMRRRVTQLTNEMGRLTTRQKAMKAIKFGTSVVAGVGAAAYAVKSDVQNTMSYDERLSRLSMKAYENEDVAGITAGKESLRLRIKAMSREFGVSKEEAINSLDAMMADGMVLEEALTTLPKTLRARAATGIAAEEFARLGTAATQNMGISADDMAKVYNMAAAGGMAGKYEVGDIVRGAPEQTAKAKAAGMSGIQGFADIIAANEAAARAAGSASEAGTNVSGLLSDLTSPKLASKIKQVTKLNASKYFAKQGEQGFSRIAALTNLIDSTLEKDTAYARYKKELSGGNVSDERRAVLESLMTGRQGEVVGQFLGRDESRLAMLGILGNRAFYDETRQKVMTSAVDTGGVVDKQFSVAQGESWFKTQAAEESIDSSKKSFIDQFTSAIGSFSEGITKVTGGNEALAGALIVGGKAIMTFAATVGTAAILMGGRGTGVGPLTRITNGARGIGAGLAGAGRSGFSAGRFVLSAGRRVLTAGLSAAAAALGTTVGTLTAATVGSAAVGYGVGTGLDYAGERLAKGTRMEGWGTDVIGGGVAKILAFFGNKEAKSIVSMNDYVEQMYKQEPQPPVDVNAQITLSLPPGLVLQSQTVSATGGNIKMSTGNMIAGAP